MFNSVPQASVAHCAQDLASYMLPSLRENLLGNLASAYTIYDGPVEEPNITVASNDQMVIDKIKDLCFLSFGAMGAVPITKRVCGDTVPKTDPVGLSKRSFSGSIYEGASIIKEFCCKTDPLGTVGGAISFMSSQKDNIGNDMDGAMARGIYAPVVVTSPDGISTLKTLQDEAYLMPTLPSTGLNFGYFDGEIIKAIARINANISYNKFTVVVPASLYAKLMQADGTRNNCCGQWIMDPSGKFLRSNISYRIITVADNLIEKDTSGNWLIPVFQDNSLAMSLIRPRHSELCSRSCLTFLNMEIYRYLFGNSAEDIYAKDKIIFWLDCLAGDINLNTRIGFLYGFFAGRSRGDTFAIIPVPSNFTVSDVPFYGNNVVTDQASITIKGGGK